MNITPAFVIMVIIAYFMGNISPSTIQARAKGLDIKKEGSGNAGTTNTLRVLGAKAALITLTVDILKGVIAVLLGTHIVSPMCGMFCCLAVFLGHVWPVLLKFQGGKGVATAFGAITAVNPALGFISLAVVIIAVLITRKVSLGSIIISVAFPFLAYFMERDFFFIGLIMAIIIFVKHRTNLVRLARGEEPDIDFSKLKRKDK